MKKAGKILAIILFLGVLISGVRVAKAFNLFPSKISFDSVSFFSNVHELIWPSVKVPSISCPLDQDGDGMDDLTDIISGARAEVKRQPQYRSAYYKGGYPPPTEGVCTDVIWRAFKDAGYNLKAMVDKDIEENTRQYPRVASKPDPNIDFRRVPNLMVFFKRYAQTLAKEVKPGDVANLSEWQAGDIVIYDNPHEHIAIISAKRRPDGVPYIIHNAGPTPAESDSLLSWPSPITGHFRFPKF